MGLWDGCSAPLLRITVEPTTGNGLRKTSQIIVDKAISVRRERIDGTFGRLEDATIVAVDRGLVFFVGLG